MVLYLGNPENKKKLDEFNEKIHSKASDIKRDVEIYQIVQDTPEELPDLMMSLQYKIDDMIIYEYKNGVNVEEKYPWFIRFSFYNYTLSKT